MSITFNRVIEGLSSPGSEVSKLAPGAPISLKNSTDNTASSISKQSLSAHEQTVALSQRYQEAGIKVSVNFQTVEGHLVYIVKDSESGDVIRQIPSEEALRISKHLDHLTGIMLDKSVE